MAPPTPTATKRLTHAPYRCLCALTGLLCLAFVGGCGPRDAGKGTAELDRLVAACVETMVRNTCKVMAGSSASPAASTVFVAGVGPVDAKTYAELRASGESMCEVVRTACSKDWESPQCRTARSVVTPQ